MSESERPKLPPFIERLLGNALHQYERDTRRVHKRAENYLGTAAREGTTISTETAYIAALIDEIAGLRNDNRDLEQRLRKLEGGDGEHSKG